MEMFRKQKYSDLKTHCNFNPLQSKFFGVGQLEIRVDCELEVEYNFFSRAMILFKKSNI